MCKGVNPLCPPIEDPWQLILCIVLADHAWQCNLINVNCKGPTN